MSSLERASKRRTDASFVLWFQLQQGDNGPIDAQGMVDEFRDAHTDVILSLLVDKFIKDRRPGVWPVILEVVNYLNPDFQIGED